MIGEDGLVYDAHCHLDGYDDPLAVGQHLIDRGISLFSMSTSPQSYLKTRILFDQQAGLSGGVTSSFNANKIAHAAEAEEHKAMGQASGTTRHDAAADSFRAQIYLGLGMHPWEVSNHPASLRAQDEMLYLLNMQSSTSSSSKRMVIGEVGLDYAHPYRTHAQAQRCFFERLCTQLTHARPALLSLHAVKSAGEVLEVFARTQIFDRHRIVFHWFSGSGDDLLRARSFGCYFSVNARMLATKRGRAYAGQIPLNRLLIETDGPYKEWCGKSALAGAHHHIDELHRTAQVLADIHKVDLDCLESTIPSVAQILGVNSRNEG